MKIIAMIPARMGSERLKKKNLRLINGIPLITHAIRKAKNVEYFDEIWVNSENEIFGKIAKQEGVLFHKRPEKLADNQATSEDYVFEFLSKHDCSYLFQVHTIAPLLSTEDINNFIDYMISSGYDVLLSVVDEQLECIFRGEPINFTFNKKQNSQQLIPVKKITWAITGWKRDVYIESYSNGKCATYSGRVGYYELSRISSIVIKNEDDLMLANAIYNIIYEKK